MAGENSFDIIGLPPDTVRMYSHNKTEKVAAAPLASKRLMDQVCERIRYLHYSLKTERVYLCWARFSVFWNAKQSA